MLARYANSNRGVFHPSLSQDARSCSPAYYYEQVYAFANAIRIIV